MSSALQTEMSVEMAVMNVMRMPAAETLLAVTHALATLAFLEMAPAVQKCKDCHVVLDTNRGVVGAWVS